MFTHESIDKINEFEIFNGFKIFRSLKFNVSNAINIDFFLLFSLLKWQKIMKHTRRQKMKHKNFI